MDGQVEKWVDGYLLSQVSSWGLTRREIVKPTNKVFVP
jgi:hypothetical protein